MKPMKRRFWAACLLVSISAAFIVPFIGIWQYGSFNYVVYEPNRVVLIIETLFMLFCFGFGIYNCIVELKDIKRHRKIRRLE
ncbi:MAG: hypothetical protein PHQ43_08360 [Dehalococcoidales bacterium]|nr:hypothetical protein [Dehalococcoidales bacterium]